MSSTYLVGAFCLGGVLTYNHACLWRRLRKNSKLTILDPFFRKNRRYVQPTMKLTESIYNCSDLHLHYRIVTKSVRQFFSCFLQSEIQHKVSRKQNFYLMYFYQSHLWPLSKCWNFKVWLYSQILRKKSWLSLVLVPILELGLDFFQAFQMSY